MAMGEECEKDIRELKEKLDVYEEKVNNYEVEVKFLRKENSEQKEELKRYEAKLAILEAGVEMLTDQLCASEIDPVWTLPKKKNNTKP